MAIKHTPGPLAVSGTTIRKPQRSYAGQSSIVALAPAATDPQTKRETSANLRLFAAAPGLLAALVKITDIPDDNGMTVLTAEDMADIHAAIAKAEGR